MDTLVSELSQTLGRSPTTAELAASAGVREEDVLEAMEIGQCYRPSSLDVNINGAGPTLVVGALDERLGSVEDRAALAALLDRLPDRERRILHMRYFEDLTQAEIAAEIGVSQMHVSRLLSRSLALLANTESRIEA